jgi:hypothetical protein
LLTGLLAACDASRNETPATPDSSGAAAQDAEAAPGALPKAVRPTPAPEGQKGVDVLARSGVVLSFPHAINYDILDQSRNGTPRHRVLVEVLDSDFATVVDEFGQSLVEQGYALAKDGSTDGRIKRTYIRKGAPTYYLLMQPVAVGPKLANPDATGSIHIMWNRQ